MSQSSTFSNLISSQQSALESSQALFNISLSSLEKLSRLQLGSTRQSAESLFEHSKQLLSAKDPGEVASRQSDFIRPQLESIASYLHQFWSLSLEAQASIVQQIERGQSEWNRAITSSLDHYANSSKGSELTVTAIKSAISAANSAFDQANKTARQVADITEASVSAATSASLRASESLSGSAASRKKAA